MNSLMKFSVVALTAVTLTACAGTEQQRAMEMAPSGSGYTDELSKGYLDVSSREYGEGDYRDSDRFARNSMSAASGENVPAPDMGSWNIPAEYTGEISAASQRLNSALSKGAASVAPADTAKAQVNLDCWMQEAEENWPWQEEDRAFCRDNFNDAMAKVEAALAPAPVAAVAPNDYLVFFDFAKWDLTPEAVDIVNAAASSAMAPGTSITVIGNTDTVGSAEFNMVLGQKRADAVAAQLIAAGVQGTIVAESRDEESPLVPTGDGVAEPQNRRAEILISKPAM
jgi:outer membrane protein OmpA-like peptidoglycan-associated protein